MTPVTGIITCNICDMLMRWSDDRLLSNPHRVRTPRPDDILAPLVACVLRPGQPRSAVAGAAETPAAITATDYIQLRLQANFTELATR